MVSGPSDDPVAIIVGGHPFPHGNASANRMLGLARTLSEGDLSTLIVNDDPRLAEVGLRQSGTASGIPFLNLGAPSATRLKRWNRRRTFGRRVAAAVIETTVSPGRVRVIGVPSHFFTPATLRALRGIAPEAVIIVDVVERHDPQQFPRGRFEPYFIRHRLTSWYAKRAADRVVVISQALADGPFRSREPFVLPPTVETADFALASRSRRPEGEVAITYVGSPGSKDDLGGLVRAIGHLSQADRKHIRLVVGGVTWDEMAALPGLSPHALAQIADVLEVVGRLDRLGVAALLGRSHFTVLIRDPNAGFARFGFPTKVPESMAAGCPPILNFTSDLGLYLSDGNDALICRSDSAEDIAASLRRAVLEVREGRHAILSASAVRTAQERFTSGAWAQQLVTWISVDSKFAR